MVGSRRLSGGIANAVVVVAALALAGCGDEPSGFASGESDAERAALPQLLEGERVYREHCAVCHGEDGRGGRVAPAYPDMENMPAYAGHSPAALRSVIEDGHAGRRGWDRFMTQQELTDLVAYVRKRWSQKE